MKKKILFIASIALIASSLTIALLNTKNNIKTIAYEKATELFCNDKNIDIKENMSLPSSFKDSEGNDVETDFDLEMGSGVLLTSTTNGSSVDLAPLFSSNFEIKMRPYSDVIDYNVNYNDATIEMNPYCDIKEIKLTFQDINNNKFDVVIRGGEKWNILSPSAKVVVNGSKFGYYYERDGIIPITTSLKNSQGYYTRIHGTTFSNIAYTGGKKSSSESMPLTIGYNADSMEVYTYTYGIDKRYDDGQYRVIAKLNSDDFGLNRINSFDKYKVTMSFPEITTNKMAKVLVYSINGQSLSGQKIINDYGPMTSYTLKQEAILNNKYFLPKPNCFDILENNQDNSFKTEIKILDNTNKTYLLYDKNNSVIENNIYQDGCYFIPTNKGKVTVNYVSYDSDNLKGKENIKELNVLESLGNINYKFNDLDKNYVFNPNKGLNSILNIIPVEVESNVLKEKTYANVSLYLNDKIFKDIKEETISLKTPVVLDKVGTYKLVYSIDNYYNEDVCYTFIVDENTPLIELSSQIDTTYAYNSVFQVPSASIDNKKASFSIYNPDGTLLPLKSSFQLDEIGMYNLTYMGRVNGKVYQYKYYFNVAHSSLNLFTCEDGMNSSFGNTENLFASKQYGQLITSTKANKKAIFNQVIDLTSNTKDDILLQFITIPNNIGYFDAYQYRFTLTDVNDENNYVDIILYKGSWGNEFSYVKVGASNQIPGGLEMGNVLTTYNTGTPVNYSMSGDNLSGCEKFTLYYDNDERAFYVDNIKRPGYSYGNLILDLDNPNYVSETNLWKGFSTNEVKLSVSIEMLQESSASLLLTKINGVSYDNLWVEDNVAPNIYIDTLGYDEASLPNGLVNVSYPLFKAKGFDSLDGKVDVNYKVYKNYQTIDQEEVQIDNNSFIPNEAGTYTIVYFASDKAGNYFSKNISIEVKDSLEKLNYVLKENLPKNTFVGKYLTLPQGMLLGGSGNITLKIEVKDPNNSIQELDLKNKTIFFEKEGTYQIIFTLTDFLQNKEVITHDIDVTVSLNPIVNDFTFNDTLIEGYSYDLSTFKAYDYKDNCESSYSYEIVQNGKTTKLENNIYIPSATTNQEEVTIRFIATSKDKKGQTIEEVKAHILKVFSGKMFNLSNLFYQEGINEVILNDNDVIYYTLEDNAKLTYANYLIAYGLETSFKVDHENNNYEKIIITMKDSKKINQKVTYTICKNEVSKTISKVVFNDGNEYVITGDFYNNTTYGFNIRYNDNNNSIIDANTNASIGKFVQYDNGNSFEGFSSGLVKISLELSGVSGKSGLIVQGIANQVISNDTKDRTDPLINIMGKLENNPQINQVMTIPYAIVADAIDPNAKVSLIISDEDGIIYEGDISKDYQFTPTKYGKYTISYVATDINKRSKIFPYIITVKDHIPPTITLDGQVKSSYKLGSTYELPKATIQDNNDQDLQVYLYIENPDGELRLNDNDDYSFTPTLKGYYTIIYYAQDTYYNYAMQQYVVYVG